MKIIIPIMGFGRSGGNRVLAELANHWLSEGHDVDFLVNEASSIPYFPTNANIRWTSFTGKLITAQERLARSGCKVSGWMNLLGLYISLTEIGKDYDVIIANHSLTAWPVAFANAGNARKFYYIQAYEPEYYALVKGLKSRLLEWLSRRSYEFDLIQICNAPIYIGYKNIRAKEWVPPGIDSDHFYSKSEYKDLNDAQEIVLGCIGRKEPAKGIKYVLEAFEVLYEQDQRFKLYVAYGNLPDGWTHPGLKIVVPQNDKELGEYYRSLDIMLAPGISQLGAPHYPVMEAMASGVPVVTTGYLPASDRNSWIVNAGCSHSIVVAINDIVNGNDYITKVTQASNDIAGFEWSAVANSMSKILMNRGV